MRSENDEWMNIPIIRSPDLLLQTSPGDLGVEVEVEHIRALRNIELWDLKGDGSLRGEYSGEYVFSRPLKKDKALEAIRDLSNLLGDDFPTSLRTGVHVHVNCQNLTVKELVRFCCVYWSMETLLVNWCGQNRGGNHFCLRIRDAYSPITYLRNAIDTRSLRSLNTDEIRYSSLNLRAVPIYGSVEFRALQTFPGLAKLEDWTEILLRIRDYAVKNPDFSPDVISAEGPSNWVREVLGDKYDTVMADWHHDDIDRIIYEDMRETQPLMYL